MEVVQRLSVVFTLKFLLYRIPGDRFISLLFSMIYRPETTDDTILTSFLHRVRRVSSVLSLLVAAFPAFGSREVPNFNLLDVWGQNCELHRASGKAVVLFFTGVGCPIARKSTAQIREIEKEFGSRGVSVWFVDSYAEDKPDDIQGQANETGSIHFPQLRDQRQTLALALGIKRTAEVVAINTQDWRVFYQGAIDDQYAEGSERAAAKNHYLKDALAEFLEGKPVKTSNTTSHGCLISYAKVGGADGVPSYTHDVAPILREHCVGCHRRGDIGQWNMDGYGTVKNNADMIAEVLLERRMPPWDPDPSYGHFLSDNRLSREEVQTLMRWSQAGAPRGEGEDPLVAQPVPPPSEWKLGKPDLVAHPTELQKIPATGVFEYRHLPLDISLNKEVWISGMEIKPGNRKVVHHGIVYAKWPGCPDMGDGKGVFLVGWAPGTPAMRYPAGVGKRLPANAQISIEMHYTACGSDETDETSVAFYFWPEPQARVAETREAVEWNLNLPPGSDEARHSATYAFTRPATLYSLAPHMHVRGKSMRYDLLLPDGSRETLLSVPSYDFNWQFTYALAEPRHVPAGSWLLVTGSFDNSALKHRNPDPNKRVRFGPQSWDEMFIGFFEAADEPPVVAANQPDVKPPATGGSN